MSNLIKQQSVKRIIEDLQTLSPVDFENVGHNVICYIEKSTSFRHPGINKDNIPVKGSVDTISQEKNIVAEYSIEKDYFKTSNKPLHDLQHVYDTQKNCKRLYLLSSNVLPPSYSLDDNDEYKKYKSCFEIYFYGAKEIAEEIYKQSQDLKIRDIFCYYLTSYSAYINQYECFGKIPTLSNDYISNQKIQISLMNHFKTQKICILNGVSGAGKTQAVIEFANSCDKEVIWMTGKDFESATSLSSIKAGRNGIAFNISGYFNTGNKLLVIDNLQQKVSQGRFAELKPGLEKECIILCTSQLHSNDEIYLPISSFDKSLIKKILKEEVDFVCYKENEEIYRVCQNSPIALKYIRNAYSTLSKNYSRNSFYCDILSDITSIENDKCEILIKKITERITDDKTMDLLSFICSIKVSGFDTSILYDLIKTRKNNLESISILYPEQEYNILHIHDLVRKALAKDNDSNEKYLEYLNSLVASQNGKMTTAILHQAYLSRTLLSQFLEKEINNNLLWLYYLILQINGTERSKVVSLFKDSKINTNTTLPELLCIIDSNENQLLHDKETKEIEYNKWITSLQNAIQLFAGNDIYLLNIYHHLGKAYRRHGELNFAKDYFEKVLELNPNYFETWNQIINLGTKSSATIDLQNFGKEYFEKMLTQIMNSSESVTLRIKLAFITFSNSSRYRNIIKKYSCIELFSKIITQSYLQGFEQIYEAFVSFVRLYGYTNPNETRELFDSINSILLIDTKYTKINNFSDFLDSFATIYSIHDDSTVKEGIKFILITVINSAITKDINDFEKRAILKTYVGLDLIDDALNYFENNCIKESYSKDDFYSLYYYAKALYQKHEYWKSLNICEKIEKIGSSFNLNNTFEIKALCYRELKQIDKAIRILKVAIDLTENEKYKNSLGKMLEQFLAIQDGI